MVQICLGRRQTLGLLGEQEILHNVFRNRILIAWKNTSETSSIEKIKIDWKHKKYDIPYDSVRAKYRYHKTRVLSKLSVHENNHFLKSFSREVRLMKCINQSLEYQYKTKI